MILKVTVLKGFKRLPSIALYHWTKKHNKFLKKYLPNISVRRFSNRDVNLYTNLFDAVDVQKYLNFITGESSHDLQEEERESIIRLLQKKQDLERDLKILESMKSENDKDLEKLIASEKKHYLESIELIKKEILVRILPKDSEDDHRNVDLQIVSGIGGEESKLFSKELLQMYIHYADYKNWTCSVNINNNYLCISGDFAFGCLKHEAGVHRIQRVPETEKSGRIHTSTCSVIILPQPKPLEIQILQKDLVIERIKSSGPGGQNVNKRDTCVRVKHIPSGVIVESQSSRYQYENLKEAINKLKTILFNMKSERILSERNTLRKDQVGINDYSDKIRTYHYPQNRVTDHRLNYTWPNLIGFLSGKNELDYCISQMVEFRKREKFFLEVNSILKSVEYKNFEKQHKRFTSE